MIPRQLAPTRSQVKKSNSLEDTNDVNVTNTSGALLNDQSSHVIQRPLPVNRI